MSSASLSIFLPNKSSTVAKFNSLKKSSSTSFGSGEGDFFGLAVAFHSPCLALSDSAVLVPVGAEKNSKVVLSAAKCSNSILV